jgi:hypothetical protein
MSAGRCFAALLFAACYFADDALAQGVKLDWRRPVASTCPSATVLRQDVEANLGRPTFTDSESAWLQISGRIDELESGVGVHLEARDNRGVLLGARELETQRGRCAALRGAIALALTLLIEHQLPPPEAAQSHIGLEGALLVESLPRAVIGAGPLLWMPLASMLQLQLSAAYFWPVVLHSTRGIRATVHTMSVTARLCPRLASIGDGALTLYACAGLQAGAWLTLQSRGGSASELRAQLHGLVELRAAIKILSASRIEVGIAPLIALNRVELFSVHGDDGERVLLHRAPPFALIFSLGFVI